MFKQVHNRPKQLLALFALAALLIAPPLAAPAHACGGTSTGAGQCGG